MEKHHLPYNAEWFTDPAMIAPKGPLARFRASLVTVEQRIIKRNAARRWA
jgi:hypothetical protein